MRICAQRHYERNYEYIQLNALLMRIAELYRKIVEDIRLDFKYFRVYFIGSGHHECVANKEFVFRGAPGQRIADFSEYIFNENFPKAQVCYHKSYRFAKNCPSPETHNTG